MEALPDHDKKRLGALLVNKGLITEDQLQTALNEQKKHPGRIGYRLVALGFIPAETLGQFLQENKPAGTINIHLRAIKKAAEALPRSLAHYYKIAPILIEGNTFMIGLAEVNHPHLIELLREITGCQIDALMLPEQEIRSIIETCYPQATEPGIEYSSIDDNAFTVTDSKSGIKALAASQWRSATSSAQRLRSIIAEAIKEKLREIVLYPTPVQTEVLFKKEQARPTEFRLSSSEHDELSFLIFSLAKLNVLKQSIAQHGRFLVKINERKIPMVVSTAPTLYGTRFVLEMFDERLLKHSYEEVLKRFPEVHRDLEDFLVPDKKGALIITGPEGSGRTRFLYSLLIRAREIFPNIHTLENSIRYPLSRIHQSELSDDQMEGALEPFLYDSPDLVAISVVKNARIAEAAFLLAARTPVIMVLSSYDAYKAIEWLANHNLKSAIKAGLLHCVVSPRTMPGLCPHCSTPVEENTGLFPGISFPNGKLLKMNQGCEVCRTKENLSSIPLFESFRIDQQAIEWILQDQASHHLRRIARSAGRKTLYDLAMHDAAADHLDMLSVAKLQL